MKNQKHTNTQPAGGNFSKNADILICKHGRIGAILLGASAFLPIGAIATPVAIDMVFVGDKGNAADTRYNSISVGAVDYDYYIGKYEVTTTQYAAFLNAVGKTIVDQYGLYNAAMANTANNGCGIALSGSTYSVVSGYEKKPVNLVSFWSAARFCNWLTNGTDTEHGMYELNGVKNPTNGTVARNDAAWNAGGVAIASENEWYKAAYYDPNKNAPGSGGYWMYPTKSDTKPGADAANSHDSLSHTLADVGGNPGSSYAPSAYGTFDQGGNVWEWNETIIDANNRGVRGGAFIGHVSDLGASAVADALPSSVSDDIGFRVASLGTIIPEPQTYALFGGMALLGLTLLHRRNK